MISVDLGKGEQHSDAYLAINPRRVVPTLVLEDGTSIGEVPAILRYIEEIHPQKPLHGETAKERALTGMWERRVQWHNSRAIASDLAHLCYHSGVDIPCSINSRKNRV